MMRSGRTVIIKFDGVEPNPPKHKGRLGANRVRPVGVGEVVAKGHQVDMYGAFQMLGGHQAGYEVWVNTSAKVGDKIEAQSWMGGC
jgi:hypothetical protein